MGRLSIQKTVRMPAPFLSQTALQDQIDEITHAYIAKNPEFVEIAIDKDPALKSVPKEEVPQILCTYPGVVAVAVHEVAHDLYKSGNFFTAIQLAQAAKARTGIDIHPGTSIGKNLFIDHGTGDVIGGTAIIGNNTQIMHHVTLGNFIDAKEKNEKLLEHRHPIIGNDCFIGPGVQVLGRVMVGDNVNIKPMAKILGNNIVIGKGVSIGAGAVIEDGVVIKAGVKIGPGAQILFHKMKDDNDFFVIDKHVAPHAMVGRDQAGGMESLSVFSLLRHVDEQWKLLTSSKSAGPKSASVER